VVWDGSAKKPSCWKASRRTRWTRGCAPFVGVEILSFLHPVSACKTRCYAPLPPVRTGPVEDLWNSNFLGRRIVRGHDQNIPRFRLKCEELSGQTDDFSDRLRRFKDIWSNFTRIHLGGALSGRDIEAVNKTVSGLTKLLFPDPEMPVPDADLEWMVRLALEARRRVKEQQKRVFKSEFRNTHFSFTLGADGTEQFVSTPELHSDEAIESDPLPPGQVWGVSLGASETGAGLYRIDVTCSRGGGVRILNQPPPPAFRESVKVGEQNLYTRSREMVGDRNPREEEFSVQMRPMDSDKSGGGGCPGNRRHVRRNARQEYARRDGGRRRPESRGVDRGGAECGQDRRTCRRQASRDASDAGVFPPSA
jgi:hypothetical protein